MSKKKIIKDFSYPNPSDPNIQSKIYKKREFYYHYINQRPKMESYEDIKKYRDQNCKGDFKLRESQAILSNLINPHTPYRGLLIMHGTGVGKTCTAISIAEQFKEQVRKYNTNIYVLTSGPNIRENFKSELLFCTGETYLKNKDLLNQMSKAERDREMKIAINNAMQYYKILSYKTFYKKVLGEKITEKKIGTDNKIKSSYRKNEDGEVEREIVVDKITNMNNSVLIIDEAHNLTGNDYGEALKKIIKSSENLIVILLTATPMKNLADDIIDILNFIKPLDDQIQREKIFTGDRGYNMKIKPDGLEYLKDKARGYVSYFRGNIPYTFAKKVDKGILSTGLLFTPVIKCFMEDFQYKTYLETTHFFDDTLDRASSAAANFVFPGLNKNKNELIGYYSTEGINTVVSQLETDGDKLRSLINKHIFDGKLSKDIENNFIIVNENKTITGHILNKDYLRYFSIKFYKTIKRLEKLFDNTPHNKSAGTAFIYSNLVKAGGIEIFSETLVQNGYLEYQENYKEYDIKDNTIDYLTGKSYLEFKKKGNTSEFRPATFILITGAIDESGEDIPEIKQKIIREVFNNQDNINGKYIKLCLGSKVMNEGITLENIKEIHILDVHYNLGKVDQVIGRGIRMCKHMNAINDQNRFPKVNVYRYVVSIYPDGKKQKLDKKQKKNTKLSTDEILYQKAELKYLMIKEVERAIKEVSIDCPLLLNGNIFPEEIEKYKGCVYPTLENVESGKTICPAMCDFKECEYKCDSKTLNDKYWDEKNKRYITLDKNQIDYNTFNDDLAKFEIDTIKNKIKDLYRFKHVYFYDEILQIIKKSLIKEKLELFDDYFLDQAIEDMMPKTENDFNNFVDTIYDKFNRPGYIIQRGKYYIFQPFDENEEVTMFYREHLPISNTNMVSIENYVKQKFKNIKIDKTTEHTVKREQKSYDYESVLDYYNDREDNVIVGLFDKNYNKLASIDDDLFKIRESINKTHNKKRGTGIPTFKGAVCSTAKDKTYLMKLIKKIPNLDSKEIERLNKLTKEYICNELKNMLLHLEKYSTVKDGNKKTYFMIPLDHPIYEFPYNLEDRIKNRINTINKLAGRALDIVVKKSKDENITYTLVFNNEKFLSNIKNELEKLGCKLINNEWKLLLK
jgi:DNA polymerase III delta prime subunit